MMGVGFAEPLSRRDTRKQKVAVHPEITVEVPASVLLDSETWTVPGD